jgi:hypothetical protein
MPIAFNEVDEIGSELGSAAYLKIDSSSDGGCSLGALLVISARAEPLEFAYNRVRVPQPFLWRQADLKRYVQRRLTASLLSVCAQQPRIVLCLEDEVGTWLFGQDLQLEVPVARVSPAAPAPRRIDPATGELLDAESTPPAHVSWQPAPPEDASVERRLFEHLSLHGLLLEPFDRAAVGLREVYRGLAQPSDK